MGHSYLTGPSVRIVSRPNGWLIVSSPYPLHRGAVTLSTIVGRWVADAVTVKGAESVRTFHHTEATRAIHWLSAVIGEAYRRDMRSRFTGPQRYAMGRGQCPAHVSCVAPDSCPIARRDHRHLCRRSPESPVTVYCIEHDRGVADV